MNEIRALMSKMISLGPETDGKSFIECRCYCDFEGHGRASETWEEHWEIKLPLITPNYWMSTTGWRPGTGIGMTFHGRRYDEAKRRAIEFLTWYVTNIVHGYPRRAVDKPNGGDR
jgi:hypothetical protein